MMSTANVNLFKWPVIITIITFIISINFTFCRQSTSTPLVDDDDYYVDRKLNLFGRPITTTKRSGSQETCGIENNKGISGRIIGGHPAKKHQYPWILYLEVEDIGANGKSTGQSHCGASIIDSRWAITASHCLVGENNRRLPINWLIPAIHYISGNGEISHLQNLSVSRVFIHENYHSGFPKNDIALLKFKKPLDLVSDPRIRKICMEENALSKVNKNDCKVAGWGSQDSLKNNPSDVLKVVDQFITTCKIEKSDKICTYGRKAAGFGKNSKQRESPCGGDSGNALMCRAKTSNKQSPGRYIIVATVRGTLNSSYCSKNGDKGVINYSNLDYFRSWIVDKMKSIKKESEDEQDSIDKEKFSIVMLKTDDDQRPAMCAGTTIAPGWIVTSADCVKNVNRVRVYPASAVDKQIVGDSNIRPIATTTKITIHPSFKSNDSNFDSHHNLALVNIGKEESEESPSLNRVKFIAFDESSVYPTNNLENEIDSDDCVMFKWTTNSEDIENDDSQEPKKTIYSLESEPRQIYGMANCGEIVEGFDDRFEFCCLHTHPAIPFQDLDCDASGSGGGGPLFCRRPNNRQWVLAGVVVSGGDAGCSKRTRWSTIVVRIDGYEKWIDEVMKGQTTTIPTTTTTTTEANSEEDEDREARKRRKRNRARNRKPNRGENSNVNIVINNNNNNGNSDDD